MKKNLIILLIIFSSSIQLLSAQATNTEGKVVRSIQPKIMVIPFVKENEDIRTVLDNDFDFQLAITKIKEAFDNRDFTTVDFKGKLKSAIDDHLFNSENQEDIKSKLVEMSGADIYVEVNFEIIQSNGSSRVHIIVNGHDAATANSLGSKAGKSRFVNTADYSSLVSAAVDSIKEGFLNAMQAKFDDMIANGRSVKIIFNLAQGSSWKFDKEIDGLPLTDFLDQWMEKNAVKGVFNNQGAVGVECIYSDVRIPLRDDNNNNYTSNKFGLKIYQFLKSKGIDCGKNVVGGNIYITIK